MVPFNNPGGRSMLDRRQSARDKVIYGGVAEIDELGTTADCVVHNVSEQGASLGFSSAVKLPKGQISLTIARKGRSFLAKIIWWRDNFIGVAFNGETTSELPVSDLEERLRKSEQKKRQLQRQIKELIGDN
jgi:PilZ domain